MFTLLNFRLIYASATHDSSFGPSNSEGRLFAVYYNHDRPLVKTDNRPASVRAHDFAGTSIGTFGGHYIQDIPTAAGAFDLLAWGAVETGTWGAQTQKAGAATGEIGFQQKEFGRLCPCEAECSDPTVTTCGTPGPGHSSRGRSAIWGGLQMVSASLPMFTTPARILS